MQASYDAWIFDLYGTLVDIQTNEQVPRFWKGLANYLNLRGIACTPASLRREYGARCRAAQEAAEKRLVEKGIPGPAEFNLLAVWRQFFRDHGQDWQETALWNFSCLFRGFSLQTLRLYPGALSLLSALRKAGKRIYLLTNAQSAFTRPELACLGLKGRFDEVFISSEVGVKKPSPAFWEFLAKEGVDFGRALMIGNDDVCDCHAAARLGMDSLYLPTAQSPALSGPLPENCQTIACLTDALAFLEHDKN